MEYMLILILNFVPAVDRLEGEHTAAQVYYGIYNLEECRRREIIEVAFIENNSDTKVTSLCLADISAPNALAFK